MVMLKPKLTMTGSLPIPPSPIVSATSFTSNADTFVIIVEAISIFGNCGIHEF